MFYSAYFNSLFGDIKEKRTLYSRQPLAKRGPEFQLLGAEFKTTHEGGGSILSPTLRSAPPPQLKGEFPKLGGMGIVKIQRTSGVTIFVASFDPYLDSSVNSLGPWVLL